MQAAVNAIKTHMMRGGIKHIPMGPFPHYQQIHDEIKRQPNQDVKPFMYHPHSRPSSVSPRLEYGRSSHPPNDSPPRRSRSPHRLSDTEDHYHHHHHPRQDSIVLEHSYREKRTGGSSHVVYPKESIYYRGGVGEVKREDEAAAVYGGGMERKRRYSDRENMDDERAHRSYHYTDRHPHHRTHRVERRSSASDYSAFRHKNASPTPDSRLALYEENARKYAEERLKVLDRFHFGRDNHLFRRHGSPNAYERREREHNGNSVTKYKEARGETHSPSVSRGGVYENSERPTLYDRGEERSPPQPPSSLSRPQSRGSETGHSPGESHGAPAMVLSTNYLPTARRKPSPKPQYESPEEPRCYMYRRYSPMIDVSTQTGTSTTNISEDTTSATTEKQIKKEKTSEDSMVNLRNGSEEQQPQYRKHWKVPSPIDTTRYDDDREHFEYHKGTDHHNHHHHHHSPRTSPNENGASTKCGCTETIESPSGTGTVVVYPKEIV